MPGLGTSFSEAEIILGTPLMTPLFSQKPRRLSNWRASRARRAERRAEHALVTRESTSFTYHSYDTEDFRH